MSDLRPDFRYRPVDNTPAHTGGEEGTMFFSNFGGKRKFLPALLSLAVVCVFSVIVVYAYKQGTKAGTQGNAAQVPIIQADATPYKMKPEDPGGQDVPYQEMLVLNGGAAAEAAQPVRVINTSEEPMEKPTASADATQPKIISLRDLPDDPMAENEADHVVKLDATKANAVTPAAGTDLPTPKAEIAAAPTPTPAPVQKAEPKPVTTAALTNTQLSITSGSWRIQLGSFKDQGAASQAWTKLQKQFPTQLSGLSHDTARADLGVKGVYYRVQAINLSQSSAKALCDQINAQKSGGCLVVKAQ